MKGLKFFLIRILPNEDSNPCSLKSLMALMAFWLVFSTFPVRIIFREADGLGILPIHNLQSDKKNNAYL